MPRSESDQIVRALRERGHEVVGLDCFTDYYDVALKEEDAHGLDVRRFASATDMSFGVAIVMAVLVFVGFLVSSVRLLRRMDVP